MNINKIVKNKVKKVIGRWLSAELQLFALQEYDWKLFSFKLSLILQPRI